MAYSDGVSRWGGCSDPGEILGRGPRGGGALWGDGDRAVQDPQCAAVEAFLSMRGVGEVPDLQGASADAFLVRGAGLA